MGSSNRPYAGRDLRGAFARRAVTVDIDGTGAPSIRFAAAAIALLMTLVLAAALATPAAHAAEEEGTPQFVTLGELGKVNPEDAAVMPPGEWRYINGLDVNWKTGNVYALDPNMSRVQVFNSNGEFLFAFGSEGEGAGQFGKYSSQGLSIDQETGDVYVGEAGGPFSNSRVSKFKENGEFILTFGKEVNATTEGDICTAASGDECRHGNTHEGGNQHDGEISQGAAPIVNQLTHAVLVPLPGPGRVQEFSSGGAFIQSFPTEKVGEFIQANGEFLYGRSTSGPLLKWTSTGTLTGLFSPGFGPEGDFTVNQIYIAPGTDAPTESRLFSSMFDLAHGYTAIGEWTLGGELVQEHAPGLGGGGQIYVAVDPVNHKIYATNGYPDGRLFVLGKPVTLPKATIQPVTNLTDNSATLHGLVNPEGSPFSTGYHFEYRRDVDSKFINVPHNEGGFPADIDVGGGTSDVPAEVGIEGLEPNTLYHARLVANRKEGGGTGISEDLTFTTKPVPPVLSLIAATHVTDTHATLQAAIDAKHAPTKYHFEYGTTSAYGTSLPANLEGDAGSKLGPSGVFEQLDGLLPGTTYHFKVVATNVGGTVEGEDLTFHTYSSAELVWPARDLEMVNNPDKGNQNAFPAPGIWRNPISYSGNEVAWGTFSGAPGSPSGFAAIFLAKRDPATGWHSQAIGPKSAEEMIGGGDLFYAVSAASKDFSTYVVAAEAGFFDTNHPHVWVRLTLDGEQELIQDTGAESLSRVAVSDDGEHIVYQTPEGEFIDLHDGVKAEIPTPSCGFEIEQNGNVEGGYPYLATKDFSRFFVHSNGNDASCESPGVYMINRLTGTISEIAPGGHFIRTNPDGTVVIFTRADGPEGKDVNYYKWTESGGAECLSCGLIPEPKSPEAAVVSDDLSHIYFIMRPPGGNFEFHNVFALNVQGHTVKRIAAIRSEVGENPMEVTPDGKTLIFMNIQNYVASADDTGGSGQLYRYDDDTGYVECVSCRGTAGPQDGGIGGSYGVPFKMSADGSTISFVTDVALTVDDINARVDVYEWHNGVTRLVTDGESEFSRIGSDAPGLWGLSEDGRTLLFGEGGVPITGNEIDHLTNAYAAVVGGPGFPPPNPPAHCVEDSCQGPLQAPPVLETQGSEKFSGPGNPVPNRGHKKGKKRAKHKHRKRHRHGKHSTRRHG